MIAAVAALIALAFALAFVKTIRNPLADLVATLRRHEANDYGTPVPHAGLSNEIGAIARAIDMLGTEQVGRIGKDREDLDVTRVIVSKPAFRGRALGSIPMPDFPVRIGHVRRGDSVLLPDGTVLVTNDQRMPSLPGLEVVRLQELEQLSG